MHISDDLKDRIKNEEEGAIQIIYKKNRKGFILFAGRYGLDREDVLDIYQDAVIVLIENIKKGKTEGLNSSLSTYLFGIGKVLIAQRLKRQGRVVRVDDRYISDLPDQEPDENERVPLLRTAFQKLGEPCRRLLTLFYYEEKKLEEIQLMLGYSTKNVLKTQKSRCLKQLKDLVKK